MSNSIYTYPTVTGLDIEIGKQETIEKVFISETFLAVSLSDPGELIRTGTASDKSCGSDRNKRLDHGP